MLKRPYSCPFIPFWNKDFWLYYCIRGRGMAVNTSNGAVTTLVEADAKNVKTSGIDKKKAAKRVESHINFMTERSFAAFFRAKKEVAENQG